ncbi:NodS family protein [Bosea sp. Root381]|uniref:class I SAM-dependent DNA methyltransferase n=1 Tax=Bosea sp. Root381 TaxID=1736524 RepID=UPI0006FB1CAC|nr:class I SAM-dependent methyltransferase [Bosea sp. Root381]KRE13874.1 NodS family protein [Bosea sp. Root381]
MRARKSLPPEYFERMFAGTPDPWGFETSPYERAKYEHSIAALGGHHYRQGFEIGCANGVLTRQLARHCDNLLAVDVSETALASARDRCSEFHGVRFALMGFPGEAPTEATFDLIVVSEVAYYWDDADLRQAARQLHGLLAPGGDLLLVHWTGETDYPQSGDDAVGALQQAMASDVLSVLHERRPEYRLDLWRRSPA